MTVLFVTLYALKCINYRSGKTQNVVLALLLLISMWGNLYKLVVVYCLHVFPVHYIFAKLSLDATSPWQVPRVNVPARLLK